MPTFLEQRLRLRTDRAAWSTLGYSMGGWCAARPPLSVTSVVQLDSGHRMSVWLEALPRALAWLAASVPGWSGGGSPPPAAGSASS